METAAVYFNANDLGKCFRPLLASLKIGFKLYHSLCPIMFLFLHSVDATK